MGKVEVETMGRIRVVTITRPEVRNAVDAETAALLHEAFQDFNTDVGVDVAVLTGADGHFCAGADLHQLPEEAGNRLTEEGPGPMGPTRMQLTKPVIAAIEGYAVAGGLELATWCDLRVAGEGAVLGVFCRRLGVPLVDGGTVRLPRLIGHSRAMDMILTGRGLGAQEAFEIGLVNRLTTPGRALGVAVELATEIAGYPQNCMRNDRRSAYEQWSMSVQNAMANEFRHGMATINSGETVSGAGRFSAGEGRHGEPV